jgi:2-amino-4-hydroxy-6-hydroxymethyldihydropteridine diphosphokinase
MTLFQQNGVSRSSVPAGLDRIVGLIWIGLGGNMWGTWGAPNESFNAALSALETYGLRVVGRSHLYATAPVGQVRQPYFINTVIALRGSVGPASLLRIAKKLEQAAGRRNGVRWGPRPLDIDLLDYSGRRLGGPGRRTLTGRLQLPHPELHRRGFVLVPLARLAPHWRHPVLGVSAARLLGRNPALRRGIRDLGPFRN